MLENLKERNLKNEIIDFIKDLAIVIVIVLFIRTYFILPFQISGQSMYSSYYDREFIIVDRFSYLDIPFIWWITDPKRWDVIVFRPHVSETKEYFIKRIIAISWDTLKINDWKVYLKKNWDEDFAELNEKYLNLTNKNSTFISGSNKEFIYEVPDDSYFVMWDNRNWSTDSRTCFSSCKLEIHDNFIKSGDIIGRLFIDLWYFNFRTFSFKHPSLGIDTTPKFFSSDNSFDY